MFMEKCSILNIEIFQLKTPRSIITGLVDEEYIQHNIF